MDWLFSAARVGAVSIGPQLKLLYVTWRLGAFLIYTIFCLITSILLWSVLPETKNRPLPDMPKELVDEKHKQTVSNAMQIHKYSQNATTMI